MNTKTSLQLKKKTDSSQSCLQPISGIKHHSQSILVV